MKKIFLYFCLLLNISAFAQGWTLLTPIKTVSKLKAVSFFNTGVGYAIDQSERRLLKTLNSGLTWSRQYYYMTSQPNDLWMWNQNKGIVCGSSGEFYLSNDGFETYITQNNPTFGSLYSIWFTDSLKGYVTGDNGKIYKTINGGLNWTLLSTPTTNILFNTFFVNDTIGFACGNQGVIIKTTDGGANWTLQNTGVTTRITDIYFINSLSGVAVGSGGLIMKTNDGGITWNNTLSPTTQYISNLFMNGNVLIASCNGGEMLRSTNFGTNWTVINAGTRDHYNVAINDLGRGISGSNACLYYTQDYGQTWSLRQGSYPKSGLNKVSFADSARGCTVGYNNMAGSNNSVLRSIDGGNSWIVVSSNSSTTAGILGVHLNADGTGAIGGSSGLNSHTNNYGQTFTAATSFPAVAVRAVWSFSDQEYIMGGGYVNSGFYKTNNGGSSWAYSSAGNIMDIWFSSDSVGYGVGEGGVCHKTTNRGQTWSNLLSSAGMDLFSVFFLNDTVGFAAGAGGGMKTSNGGLNWNPMPSPQYTQWVQFFTPDSGLGVTYSGMLIKTIDGGQNWSVITDGLIDMAVNDAAYVNGKVIAVGNSGDIFTYTLGCTLNPFTPVLSQSGDTLFSSIYYGNQWYNSSGPIPGADSYFFVPPTSDTYYVKNTDSNGCESAPSNSVQILFTGLKHIDEKINVYPNPAKNQVFVSIKNDGVPYSLNVISANGTRVFEKTTQESLNEIDLSYLSPGLYLIQISGQGLYKTVKLVRGKN